MDSSAKSSKVFNVIIFNSKGESFVIQNVTQVKAEFFIASFKDVGNLLTYKSSDSKNTSWYCFSASLIWELIPESKVPNLYKVEAAIVL